jgi:hypothetical protein
VDIACDSHPDGRPEPGEVVWTRYEDDPTHGKDRLRFNAVVAALVP